MILKGSQRGGAADLAAHLLRIDENDHVELHELRGFVAEDLRGALKEVQAISAATRCRQFLFSLSLSPPESATVSDREFREAIRMAETSLGLVGQPRAIVFHEKEGRRHAHCVWSRIDAETMRAVNLPFFKRRLTDVSRALYLKHEWRMPPGLVDSRMRNPLNFSLAEWQQAKRTSIDPRAVKALFQQCWAASDSPQALSRALEEKGFWLARGDRRSFVAVDYRGEVYSLAKYAGLRTKQVRERLGDGSALPDLVQAKAIIAARMTDALQRRVGELNETFARQQSALAASRQKMVEAHRAERAKIRAVQEERRAIEDRERNARLRSGLLGLWDRLLGRYGKMKRQNEKEALASYRRDGAEKQELRTRQIQERRALQRDIVGVRTERTAQFLELRADLARYALIREQGPSLVRDQFQSATKPKRTPILRERPHSNKNSTFQRRYPR